MRKAVFIVLCLCGWAIGASAQTCPSDRWCNTVPTSPGLNPASEDWAVLSFSHDTNKFYINIDDPGGHATPWENAFWTYTWTTSVTSTPANQAGSPWKLLSSNGSLDDKHDVAQVTMSLASSMDAVTTNPVINLCWGMNATCNSTGPTGGGGSYAPAQNGYIWVEDEIVHYTSCDEVAPTPITGSCPSGPSGGTKYAFHVDARGLRTAAGYRPMYAHSVGVNANFSGYNPSFNGVADPNNFGHPASRHPSVPAVYDAKRGRLWNAWGYQENWRITETWYLCIFATAYCNADGPAPSLTSGWQYLQMWTNGGAVPGPVPGYVQNSMALDTVNDVIIAMGGTYQGGPSSATFVFCLSATSNGYINATQTCANTWNGHPRWFQVTPHGGSPGERDAIRAVYNSVDGLVMVYGGNAGGTIINSVAAYDAATGDWCNSNTTQSALNHESNAASCAGRPTETGAPTANNFAVIAFDKLRGKMAYFNGTNFFLYQWSSNTWTSYTIPGTQPSPVNVGMSMEYSDVADGYMVETCCSGTSPAYTGTWQLPGAALTPGPSSFTYSITIAGSGSGSVSDGAGFTCSAGTCTHSYLGGATPTFTATASGGGSFAGFSSGSGDLVVCSTSPCGPVPVTQTSGMTATFSPPSSGTTRLSGVKLSGVKIQ